MESSKHQCIWHDWRINLGETYIINPIFSVNINDIFSTYKWIPCVRKHRIKHQNCDNSINKTWLMAKTVFTIVMAAVLSAILDFSESSGIIAPHPLDTRSALSCLSNYAVKWFLQNVEEYFGLVTSLYKAISRGYQKIIRSHFTFPFKNQATFYLRFSLLTFAPRPFLTRPTPCSILLKATSHISIKGLIQNKSNRFGMYLIFVMWQPMTLHWRHNGHDGVSNHQLHHYLLNRLFGRRSKKTSKRRVTGLCAGNSPATGEFPAQMASNAENVSIWWRHHEICLAVSQAPPARFTPVRKPTHEQFTSRTTVESSGKFTIHHACPWQFTDCLGLR